MLPSLPMRHFSSYGPVEPRAHFAVERRALVDQCVTQLVGLPNESGGHYFTIWGPRQSGKTWIMRQAIHAIRERFGDRFLVGAITLQGVVEGDDDNEHVASFLEQVPHLLWEGFDVKPTEAPKTQADWFKVFARAEGVFDRPVILLLDEFDSLPPKLIDRLVATFRKMYLTRDGYWLHGLALVGVRVKLFTDPNVPFTMDKDWGNYLFTNGIIDESIVDAPEKPGGRAYVCRFSSPFVQRRLFAALTDDMFGDKGPLPSIPVGDTLDDVFTPNGLCIPPLLARYRDYLKRLNDNGIDPWLGQPRRQDLHYTEAVGHFHLYAWLQNALYRCVSISPEFPTGNGKVDLLLQSQWGTALIEVKSFTQAWELKTYREQAATYAKKLGLSAAAVAVFAPTNDDAVLAKLSSETDVDGVRVTLVAFGSV